MKEECQKFFEGPSSSKRPKIMPVERHTQPPTSPKKLGQVFNCPSKSAFKDILFYPRINQKKHSRKSTPGPQHLTNPEFIQYMANKREEKKKLDEEREFKKELRKRKKEEAKTKKLEPKVFSKRGTRCYICELLWSKRQPDDVWVQCDICQGWVCFSCTKIPEETKKNLQSQSFNYICRLCTESEQ